MSPVDEPVVGFSVGPIAFSVPLAEAREVVSVPSDGGGWLFPAPGAEAPLVGLVAHRSKMVPVLAVAAIFPESAAPPPPRRHLLFLRVPEGARYALVALLVDRVVGVLPAAGAATPRFPFDARPFVARLGALAPDAASR